MRRLVLGLCLGVLAAGCASMGDALTPSARVLVDPFDGATLVRQAPVNAASSLAEGFQTLGFEWSSRRQDEVTLVAGVIGTKSVQTLAFNIDGEIVELPPPISQTTEFDAGWSYRRFAMPWPTFERLAAAADVKMRVGLMNDYGVSSFGKAHETALVNSKLPPFVDTVRRLRAGEKLPPS